MDKSKAITIMEALANGTDPMTGEIFPPESPYQDVEVVRALFMATEALKKIKMHPLLRAWRTRVSPGVRPKMKN